MAAQISKKRKFVADGVFRAELGEFFERELAEEGYSGCEVRVTHARTEVSTSASLTITAHTKYDRLSSVPPTPRTSSAKRAVAFVNSHLSFKSASSSLKDHLNYTPKRSPIVVCLLSPSANRYDTSCSVVLLFVGT
jgi:hypothetical protein